MIKTPFQPAKDQRSITHTEGADLEHLETCPYYTVEKYDIHGTWDHVFEAGFVNASVIEGEGSINGRKIKREIILSFLLILGPALLRVT